MSNKYKDFENVFSPKLVAKLSETSINDHTKKLIDDKQSLFGPIYNLELIVLKALKTYIKNNLANSFIKPFKFPAGVPILFDQKLNKSFWLYIDYRDLNNLTIKNHHLLPLVRESLDKLRQTR